MSDRTILLRKASLTCVLTMLSAQMVFAAPATSNHQDQRPAASSAPQAKMDDFEVLPDRVLRRVARGDELARLQRYDEALEEYRAANREAGHPIFTAYLNMGAMFFSKQDYSEAIEAFNQALAVRPNSWQAHYNRAEALYAAEKYSEAEKEYRRVLELPSNILRVQARHFLGLALYKQGRLVEAIAEYRAAIEQAAGKYSEARYNLGIALLDHGQPQVAEQEFRLAIELIEIGHKKEAHVLGQVGKR